MTTHSISYPSAILHPSDLSEHSEHAFQHALALALRARSGLTVLHVTDLKPGPDDWAAFPSVRSTLEHWGKLPPQSPAEAVADLGVRINKVNIWSGDDTLAPIVQHISRHGNDLIVLATEGRSGLPRWLQPSLAESIARSARMPALFVPARSHGFVDSRSGDLQLQRILVPMDFEPTPTAALSAVLQLAHLLKGEPAPEATLLHIGDGPAPMSVLPDAKAVRWRIEQGKGAVVEAILDRAEELKANLIVMTTQGQQGFLDALRGSITEQVLHHSPCPVLAIPASFGHATA